jgi:large subunit ribosomal protein L18
LRLRKKIVGSAERPRMSVFKSNKHLYVQCIDDGAGKTLVSVATLGGDLKSDDKDTAMEMGKQIGTELLAMGIDTVVFDHGGFGYKGKIKKIADAARETGLKF